MKQLSQSPEAAAAVLGVSLESAVRRLGKRRKLKGQYLVTIPPLSSKLDAGKPRAHGEER